jgi:uncharacterized membrane protein
MRLKRIIVSLVLLLTIALVISQPATALAQDEESPIKLTPVNTKLEGESGDSFEFEVKIDYTGDTAEFYDLTVTGPQQWAFYLSPSYPKEKKIMDVRLDPDGGRQTVLVHVSSPFWLTVEPGSYDITLEVSSGEIRNSVTLQAIITAEYKMSIWPAGEPRLYSTKATVNKDNFYTIVIENTGTDTINNIRLSADKPDGWNVEFSIEEIDALEAGQTQNVDVNIKPGDKAIAGAYEIELRCFGKEADARSLTVRVNVETPSIWGWTGVVIILVVVAGLSFMIMRFSRR